MRNRRGSVLILVLWSILLFATLATSMGLGVRRRATLLMRIEAVDSLSYLASCGLDKARAVLIEDDTIDVDTLQDTWASSPSDFRTVPAGSGTFSVSVDEDGAPRYGLDDEESRVNANKADAPTLARLIENVAGIGRDEAEDLAYCIVDWRDQDSNFQHPTFGAEDPYYDDLPKPYACKDAPMESIQELLLIKGMKRDIFEKIRPFLSVYGSGSVNANTAPKTILMALGLDERAAGKILAYRAGQDGRPGTADDLSFLQAQSIVNELDRGTPPPDGPERTAISNLILAEKLGAHSTAFRLRSRGESPNGSCVEMEAVIDRYGNVLSTRFSGLKWPSQKSA